MRMPKAPPKLALGAGVERVADLFAQGTTVDGRYLHWDELRHREPPDGIDHESWWRLIRLRRSWGSREVAGLRDLSGRSFRYTLIEPMERRLHELSMQAGGSVQMPEQVSTDARDQYIVRSLIEEALTSSQLEGAVTTREVARDLLQSRRKPRDRSERMVLNNFLTMQRIRELRSEPLTRALVFELHRLVTDGTLDSADGAGRFRRESEQRAVMDVEGNVFHHPPPARELAERLERMLHFANEEPEPFVHPVLRAIILHFWVAYDHPFVDGNGRTARALFYWLMLRQGFWLMEFISISERILQAPMKYYRAFLFTETDENDLTYFLIHQLDVIDAAVDGLHAYIARRTEALRETEAQLQVRGGPALNLRQKELIRHALRHPFARYTIEGHQRSHQTAYATARADLLGLVDAGLFERRREGKRFVFGAIPDLARALSSTG